MEQLSAQIGPLGPLVVSAIQALIFLIVGWFVAGALSGLVRRSLTRNPRIDEPYLSPGARKRMSAVHRVGILPLATAEK